MSSEAFMVRSKHVCVFVCMLKANKSINWPQSRDAVVELAMSSSGAVPALSLSAASFLQRAVNSGSLSRYLES